MKISDSQLYAILASLLDSEGVATMAPRNAGSEDLNVSVKLEVHDNHRGDSPDVLLWIDLSIVHPKLPPLKLKIPIPIEGEKAGIGAALEDLKKFSEREHFPLKMPMLVVGGAGNPARSTKSTHLPAKFEITQIPYRVLTD